MRALCGAIITAGALIGLGLLSVGIGMRYQGVVTHDAKGEPQFIYFRHLDTAFLVAFAVLVAALVIGLGIAFVGLAYHHHRRHWEMTRLHHPATGGPPATAAPPPPGERVSA